MELSLEEIDILLVAIDGWRSEQMISSDDWSDVYALEKRLLEHREVVREKEKQAAI